MTAMERVQVSWMRGEAGHGPQALAVAGQVLLFLLVTLLGVATGNVTKTSGVLPWGLEIAPR
jgi:hypothetical protein